MWLKFIGGDRGSFSGGLLPFLPVCCRDRTERVSAVRTIRMLCLISVNGRYKKAPEGF
ncbi:plasmid mobilization protein [Salmonella enterica subsp. enterica]|nr:plasmid mobilization protein [Salmonella enterica subsp. enterica serovar Enteritidis]EAA3315502.1 plasmid mobilization protein [Salmonella enterica subsp. enterica serovar Enteritidis]EBQ9973420.1 plasmid mobilization protein [Salmonella enterica subsp. enterica serovar Enteritidis]EBR0024692.1 plasmid mobilization protein [Salmonella enterica subsp. enterica serovar Enteritidis]EBR0093657.1 plasmid mobilization protein [Salmonella enterica subsp. enterica serovar Enteritidis]